MKEVVFYSLFISLLWGTSSILQKLLIIELSKDEVLYINNLLYFSAINLYLYEDLGKIHSKILNLEIKHIVYFFLFSIVCIFVSNIIYYRLLEIHNPGVISAIVSINPIWTLVISYYMFNEKITSNKCFGILLILCGVYFISN